MSPDFQLQRRETAWRCTAFVPICSLWQNMCRPCKYIHDGGWIMMFFCAGLGGSFRA